MAARLSVVGGEAAGEGPPLYPLPAHVSLAGFACVNDRPAWLLGSEMVAVGGASAALASWMLLRAHAFATQAPGGTLPVDDAHLAGLAGCDGPEWTRRRALALHGWRPVRVRAENGADAGTRLAHPEVQAEAERLWAALMDRQDQRAANALLQDRARIRGQLAKLGADRRLMAQEPVERMRIWLRARGLTIRLGHVQSAAAEVGADWIAGAFGGDAFGGGAR